MGEGKGKVRTKVHYHLKAESTDGKLWRWTTLQCEWQWCKMGHLILVGSKCSIRMAWWKTLKEAILFTCGVSAGLHHFRNPPSPDYDGSSPSGEEAGPDTKLA